MGKKCHICGKEVKENYYLDKRGYTCYTCSKATEKIKELEEENEQLQSRINAYDVALKRLQDLTERKLKENEQLKQKNKRMTEKLNQLALEFLNYDMVTMGKATEISEMCYYDFLKYRKENGNPMELQL